MFKCVANGCFNGQRLSIAEKYTYCREVHLLQRSTLIAEKYTYCREVRLLQRSTLIAEKYTYCREVRLLQVLLF